MQTSIAKFANKNCATRIISAEDVGKSTKATSIFAVAVTAQRNSWQKLVMNILVGPYGQERVARKSVQLVVWRKTRMKLHRASFVLCVKYIAVLVTHPFFTIIAFSEEKLLLS